VRWNARGAKSEDWLPDARDGLTRRERAVLWVLARTQEELKGRNVPTAMLYGRVLEVVDMSVAEMTAILQRFGAGRIGSTWTTPPGPESDEPDLKEPETHDKNCPPRGSDSLGGPPPSRPPTESHQVGGTSQAESHQASSYPGKGRIRP
jgi:hypothetical protein